MSALRTTAALASFAALVALTEGCQFVAGISGESSACPSPKGVPAFQCDDACTKYCTTAECDVASLYPDEGTCCLVCMTSKPATQACRTSATSIAPGTGMPKDCDKAGAFLSPAKKICDDQQGAFTDVFAAACPGLSVPFPPTFDATLGPATLLEAARARRVGCTESADCLCREVTKNAAPKAAIAACQADYDACVEACSLPPAKL